MQASLLVRKARVDAGLTQQQLAARLGVSQAAVAQLEKRGANPTVATLDKVLRAVGRRLELRAGRARSSVDETLLREALKLSPAERLAAADRLIADARSLSAAGARSRGG